MISRTEWVSWIAAKPATLEMLKRLEGSMNQAKVEGGGIETQ